MKEAEEDANLKQSLSDQFQNRMGKSDKKEEEKKKSMELDKMLLSPCVLSEVLEEEEDKS